MKLLALCMFPIALITNAVAADLKGISPGMAASELAERYAGLECFGGSSGKQYCQYSPPFSHSKRPRIVELDTFAGLPILSWFVQVADNRVALVGVKLSSEAFDRVVGALTEKFGPPAKTERSSVKNRMGAEFDQVKTRWEPPGQILRAEKRGTEIDSMAVTLTSWEAVESESARQSEEKKKSAKDL